MDENNTSNESEEIIEEVNEEEALENSKNPERTKKYIDKIKDEKKQLQDVLESLSPVNNLPEPSEEAPKPQQDIPAANNYDNLSQQEVQNIYDKLIDANGYVDVNLLKQSLKEADDRARKAEETAKQVTQNMSAMMNYIQNSEDRRMVKEAHAAYPQLDPNSPEFDQDFYDDVKDKVLTAKITTGRVDLVGIAEGVARKYQRMGITREQKERQQQADDARANISSTPTNSRRAPQPVDTDLYDRANHGDRDANRELIRRYHESLKTSK